MDMVHESDNPSRLAIPLKMLEKLLTSCETVMVMRGSLEEFSLFSVSMAGCDSPELCVCVCVWSSI